MTEPKEVLTISREFPPSFGGNGIALYNYIKHISKYRFHVLSYWDESFSSGNIKVEQLSSPFGRQRSYLGAAHYMASNIIKSLQHRECSLIIGNAFVGASVGAIVKSANGKPLMSIIHDVDYLYSKECKFNPIEKFVRKKLYEFIFKQSDLVLVPNPVIRRDIEKIFGMKAAGKVKDLMLGVDVEQFDRIEKPRGKKIVLFVGVLRRNKGIEYLIDAADLIRKDVGDFEMWIVGKVNERAYYNELRSQTRRLGLGRFVKFKGPADHYGRKNVFSYYDVCDVFAIASYHSERFGIPCVEAAMMGKPIVATDVFKENGVLLDGKTAIVVPKQDSVRLADAITMLLKDRRLRESMGKHGKAFAERFTTKNLSKKFERIIDGMV